MVFILDAQIELIAGLEEKDRRLAAYGIAGRLLLTDAWTRVLVSYALDQPTAVPGESAAQSPEEMRGGLITYAGKGWVGNEWREIECRHTGRGFYLHISGVAAYWIAANGNHVALVEADPSCPKELLSETTLGAPLVLALALQDVFCLHVSAVRVGDTLVAFAGESGQGKSTMARFLGFDSGPGWQRLIDDTLPVTINAVQGVQALPHFPQLKLANEQQPIHLIGAHTPLDVLYILDNDLQSPDNGVQIDELTRQTATLAFVQHSIGARLFDRQLLQRHLAFCVELSASIPVRRLSYPRRLECLPDARSAIETDLGV